jgi:hypothetical protein
MRAPIMRPLGLWMVTLALTLGSLGACRERRRTPPPNWQGQPGQPGWGQPQPGQPGWGQPQPGQPGWGQPQPGQPQPGQPQPGPQPTGTVPNPGGVDPINATDVAFLRQRAGAVVADLKAALPEATRTKVAGIPLFADPAVGEVNAFAACDDQGQPLMAISDGLLEVMAHSARFKAADEIFGGRRLDAYTQNLAQNVRPKQPLPRPAQNFISPAEDNDPRKLARQSHLMDEQLAFVLGHELAHHHLGHTGCANGGGSRGVSGADFGRLLSRAVPMFNQPNEIGSDVAGTNNLLAAGAKRPQRWTEGGAMLSLGFFAALDQLTPESILFGFEATHPPPQLRIPIVQNAANTWRMTGGTGLPNIFPF